MAASREKLVRNAEKFVSRGRIEAAIREYRKVLADQPRDTGTLNRVGDLYARLNRIDEAVRLFTQIAEQYTDEGFFVKAIAIYKKIIKLDPTRLSVYEKLAELYHRQGLVNEARTQYQVLADYYAKHENSTSAISIYHQMAKLEPDDPAHRVKLAELYQKGKLNDKAMEQYQLIADVMLGHGRVDQAVQVLKSGLEIDPEDLDYLAQAVDKLRAADEGDAARTFLTAAKDLNPSAASLMPQEEVSAEEEPAAGEAEHLRTEEDLPKLGGVLAEGFGEETSLEGLDSLPVSEDPPEAVSEEGSRAPGDLLPQDISLEAALAEAEAAVDGEIVGDDLAGDDDFLIGWDEEQAESLIKPPPDMAEAPEVAGTGFRDDTVGDLQTEGTDLTGSWELDLDDLAVATEDLLESSKEEAPEGAPAPEAPAEETSEPPVDPASVEPVSADGFFDTVDTSREEIAEALGEETSEASEDSREETEAETTAKVEAPEIELDLELDLEPELVDLPESMEEQPPEQSTPEDLLSEAEVLAKYGLKEKAFSRVQEVLEESPDHLGGLRVLIQLHLEDGAEEKVRELAEKLRRHSEAQGQSRDWEMAQELFAVAGFVLDTQTEAPPPKKPARKTSSKRIDRLLASLLEDDTGAGSSSRHKQRDLAIDEFFVGAKDSPPTKSKDPDSTPDLVAEMLKEEMALPSERAPAQEPQGVVAEEKPPEVFEASPEVEDPEPAAPEATDLEPAAPVAAEAEAAGSEGESVDLEDHSDIEDALAGMEPVLTMPAPETVEPTDLDETGTSWLDEVEASREVRSDSTEVFEEEEGFFVDLAAELEEELTVSDALGPQQTGEQSLEEIVQGFKRGVEEQLSEEDYDTHFDLGIAYREMGLLDEAIGEFQVASKAQEHVAACCSMLGICFLEKGLPDLAIKWYTRGLAAPGVSEEDSLALLYDLGNAYLTIGDRANAKKTLVEVYGINSHYRDVAARLDDLKEG